MRALRRQKKVVADPKPAYTDFPLFDETPKTAALVQSREISKTGVVENENCIRQAVALLMSVRKGECFFAPNRGIVRDQQLFTIQDSISKRLLESNISDDVKNQEPRLSKVVVKSTYVYERNLTELDVTLRHEQYGDSEINFNLEAGGLFYESPSAGQ